MGIDKELLEKYDGDSLEDFITATVYALGVSSERKIRAADAAMHIKLLRMQERVIGLLEGLTNAKGVTFHDGENDQMIHIKVPDGSLTAKDVVLCDNFDGTAIETVPAPGDNGNRVLGILEYPHGVDVTDINTPPKDGESCNAVRPNALSSTAEAIFDPAPEPAKRKRGKKGRRK